MPSIENELNSFNAFVKLNSGTAVSLDELFDAWRIETPSQDDLAAITASLKDLDHGEQGQPVEEFNDEIAKKHNLR